MFCDPASEGPDIIMHQLKSSYNSPFKDSHSYFVHTCFAMIASNDNAHLKVSTDNFGIRYYAHCSESVVAHNNQNQMRYSFAYRFQPCLKLNPLQILNSKLMCET